MVVEGNFRERPDVTARAFAALCRGPWVRDLNIASLASEDLLESLREPNAQGVHVVEIMATFSSSVMVEEQFLRPLPSAPRNSRMMIYEAEGGEKYHSESG